MQGTGLTIMRNLGVHCVDRSVLSPEPQERFHDSNFEIENVPKATDEENFFVGDISE